MFNPLGNFIANAPLQNAVLISARAYRDNLARNFACPHGSLQRIYAHWSVGHYNQDFPDYNGAVRYDGTHFFLDVPGDPRDNAVGVNGNPVHAHTYMRNTGAFGIATDDMVFANVHDFGPEPLTLLTLEYLCAGIAGAASAYGIDIAGTSVGGPYAGEPNVATHGEVADWPGDPVQYAPYGPAHTCERWDLASFVPAPTGSTVSAGTAKTCGDAIRSRAHLYKAAL